jgi:hypothetical protein
MVAVCRNNIVFPQVYCRNGAHSHRFLSDVQMTETADFLKAVHLRGPFLEASEEEHFSKQLDLEAYVTPREAACRAVV